MTNARLSLSLAFAVVMILAQIRPAAAFPYLTLTVFGDRPALEHIAKPLVGKDLIGRGGQGLTIPREQPDPSPAVVPAVRTPVAIPAHIQGVRVTSAPSGDAMPLASVSSMRALDDTRLIDEADSQLSVANYIAPPTESSGEPANEAEIAQAVREAAEAARASRVDRTMQDDVASELDDDLELIEFGEIDIGQMVGLTEEGAGVLGLVSVTKVFDEEDVIIDEEGRLVSVKSDGEEDDLVQWQSDAFGEVPALSASLASVDAALPGYGLSANRALIQKMALLSQPTTIAASAVSARQMAHLSSSHVVANVEAFTTRMGSSSAGQRDRDRRFSVELMWVFLKSIFARTETFVGFGLMILIGLILRHRARASAAGA